MRRLTLITIGLLAASPAPAWAQQADGLVAQLRDPAKTDRLVVRDQLWRCSGQRCVAPVSNSRAEIVCAAIARQLGPVEAFLADGVPIGADALARCNAQTDGQARQTLAGR